MYIYRAPPPPVLHYHRRPVNVERFYHHIPPYEQAHAQEYGWVEAPIDQEATFWVQEDPYQEAERRLWEIQQLRRQEAVRVQFALDERRRLEQERRREYQLRRQEEERRAYEARRQEEEQRERELRRQEEERRERELRRQEEERRERLRRREAEQARQREHDRRMEQEALARLREEESRLKNAEAFRTYEARWRDLRKATAVQAAPLSFADFPWPSLEPIRHREDITFERVKEFVLYGSKVQGKTAKEVAKAELVKWHPDKFEASPAVLSIQDRMERKRIIKGAGLVARWLNAVKASEDIKPSASSRGNSEC